MGIRSTRIGSPFADGFGRTRNQGTNAEPPSISTYADFINSATIGESIRLLGSSGATRTFAVVADPDGAKSIRFNVTWPSTSYPGVNATQNQPFTMNSSEFTNLSDVSYIFNSNNAGSASRFGVFPISGNSEGCCDPYSLIFSGVTLFEVRGQYSNAYFKVPFSNNLTSNSGNSQYRTDSSVDNGPGLNGASGFFYLS